MDSEFFLQAKGISKRFGAVQALNKVDFEVRHGEIVGLVGDNGAGKSTLMKILAGVLLPDEGEIHIEGKKIEIRSPHDARRLGIEMVYQDLALAENLDISANVFLGREAQYRLHGMSTGVLNRRHMEQVTADLLRRLKISFVSYNQKVRYLSGGQRQAVAIARALLAKAKLVILDEPTAALGVAEVEKVLQLIRQLKETGVAAVFITHRLPHIFAVTDRIIVLRGGQRVGERKTAETSIEEITKLIVGSESFVSESAI